MAKALRKVILRRSESKTKYFKRYFESLEKQKNYCSRLYKTARKNFFRNLDLPFIGYNKKVWNGVKPLFNGKTNGISNEGVLWKKD